MSMGRSRGGWVEAGAAGSHPGHPRHPWPLDIARSRPTRTPRIPSASSGGGRGDAETLACVQGVALEGLGRRARVGGVAACVPPAHAPNLATPRARRALPSRPGTVGWDESSPGAHPDPPWDTDSRWRPTRIHHGAPTRARGPPGSTPTHRLALYPPGLGAVSPPRASGKGGRDRGRPAPPCRPRSPGGGGRRRPARWWTWQ